MEESYFYFDAFNGDSDLVNFLCNRLLAILVLSLFVGVAGGSFTVGIAYCARWFKKERQGLAMGIFGAGNTGAAVTKLVAPLL